MKHEIPTYPLSIITINLNNRDGLEKTIESVVHQTYRNFEYIVIDGASTDGSVEVIQHYQDKINYWVSEPDTGIYNAMNKGIRVAQGEYLLFLNSGDWLVDSNVLLEVQQYFKIGAMVYAGDIIFSNGIHFSTKEHPETISFNYLLTRTVSHPSTFIHQSLFIKYGEYDETYKIISDWAFFFKVLAIYGCSYQRISRKISIYNTFGISSNPNNLSIINSEKEAVLKQFLPRMFYDEIDDYINYKKIFNIIEISKFVLVVKNKYTKYIFNYVLILLYYAIKIKQKIRLQ